MADRIDIGASTQEHQTEVDFDKIISGITKGRFVSFQEYGYTFDQKKDGKFEIQKDNYHYLTEKRAILGSINMADRLKRGDYALGEKELVVAVFTDPKGKEPDLDGNKVMILGLARQTHIDNTGREGSICFRLYFNDQELGMQFVKDLSHNPQRLLKAVFSKILESDLPSKTKQEVTEEKKISGRSGPFENSDPFERTPTKWTVGILSGIDKKEGGFKKLERTTYPDNLKENFEYVDQEWVIN